MRRFYFAILASFVVISLSPLVLPVDIPNNDHFFSTIQFFEYAYQSGLKFGVDVIDNVGQLGYLHYLYLYMPYGLIHRILYGSTLLIFLGVTFFYSLTFINSLIFGTLLSFSISYFTFQYLFPFYSYEVLPRLVLLFGLYALLYSNSYARYIIIGLFYIAIATLLIFVKSANIYLSLICLFTFLFDAYRKFNLRTAMFLSLFCAFLYFGLNYLLLGVIVPPATFFVNIAEFAKVYNSLFSENAPTAFGFEIFILCCGLIFSIILYLIAARYSNQHANLINQPGFIFSIVCIPFLFVIFKHGLLRDLNSLGTILYTFPTITILIASSCISTINNKSYITTIASLVICISTILFSLYVNIAYYDRLNIKYLIQNELQGRLIYATKSLDGLMGGTFGEKYQQFISNSKLSNRLINTVSNRSIDQLGSANSLIFNNGLNIKPRPVYVDFVASGQHFANINYSSLSKTENQTDFFLIENFGFRTADSLSYLQILLNYHVVLVENNLVLLKRNTDYIRPSFAHETSVNCKINDVCIIDKSYINKQLYAKFDVKYSNLGKLRAIVYKAVKPTLIIEYTNGDIFKKPVPITDLESGFLLAAIETKEDLIVRKINRSNFMNQIEKIRLSVPAEYADYLQIDYKLDLYELYCNERKCLSNELSPKINLPDINLDSNTAADTVDVLNNTGLLFTNGMYPQEHSDDGSYRWATREASVFFISDDSNSEITLEVKNGAGIENLYMELLVNGNIIGHYIVPTDQNNKLKIQNNVPLMHGTNLVTLRFDKAVLRNILDDGDHRRFSAVITSFEVRKN